MSDFTKKIKTIKLSTILEVFILKKEVLSPQDFFDDTLQGNSQNKLKISHSHLCNTT